jgi:hypothetical protein
VSDAEPVENSAEDEPGADPATPPAE